jgi:hypothetical protein
MPRVMAARLPTRPIHQCCAGVNALANPATAPTKAKRTDLINVFLKGIQGVNQPAVSAEMA